LGTLGGNSEARALSESGQIVGYSVASDGVTRGFVSDGGPMTALDIPKEFSSDAFGINVYDQVVGSIIAVAHPGIFHAFELDAGALTDLGTLGGQNSVAQAINDAGLVAGWSMVEPSSSITHAFLYDGKKLTDLGTLGGQSSAAYAINASGWVVGEARRADGVLDAFLYADGTMRDLGSLGAGLCTATAISTSGLVAGSSVNRQFHLHAFLFDGSQMVDLGTLGGNNSEAWGINDWGQAVGDAQVDRGYSAFIYADGKMTDLNSLIPPDTGLHLLRANAINNQGRIVGLANDAQAHYHAFLLVPEDNADGQAAGSFFVSGWLASPRSSEEGNRWTCLPGCAGGHAYLMGLGPQQTIWSVRMARSATSDPVKAAALKPIDNYFAVPEESDWLGVAMDTVAASRI
jgi:probable HAF family extracellular repeat protein